MLRERSRIVQACLLALVLSALVGPTGCGSSSDLDRGTVVIGGVPVSVWIADTPREREEGLQSVPRLQPGEGMLFVWEEPGIREFGIKDVDYALDIIFVSETGTVTRIESLARGGPESAGSGGSVMWALEVPGGWAESSDIRVGDMLQLGEGGSPVTP